MNPVKDERTMSPRVDEPAKDEAKMTSEELREMLETTSSRVDDLAKDGASNSDLDAALLSVERLRRRVTAAEEREEHEREAAEHERLERLRPAAREAIQKALFDGYFAEEIADLSGAARRIEAAFQRIAEKKHAHDAVLTEARQLANAAKLPMAPVMSLTNYSGFNAFLDFLTTRIRAEVESGELALAITSPLRGGH